MGFKRLPVKYLLNIFTADCLCHTAEMAVVETVWQLHTIIVINSWLTKQSSGHVGPPFSGSEAVFPVYRGDHWTIESSLKSGCSLSHESEQESYNSTYKTHLK